MDIVCVPVQIRDRAVVMPRVEHDEIKERANGEGSPDAKIIVHFDLAERVLSALLSGDVHDNAYRSGIQSK